MSSRWLLGHVHGIWTVRIICMLDYRYLTVFYLASWDNWIQWSFFCLFVVFPPPILNLCRMACLWCLICAKLQGQWQKLVGPQAIPFILYNLFYTTQPSHQVLAPFYLLLQLVCASGTLVEVKRGRLSPKFSWGTSNALQRKRNWSHAFTATRRMRFPSKFSFLVWPFLVLWIFHQFR